MALTPCQWSADGPIYFLLIKKSSIALKVLLKFQSPQAGGTTTGGGIVLMIRSKFHKKTAFYA